MIVVSVFVANAAASKALAMKLARNSFGSDTQLPRSATHTKGVSGFQGNEDK